MHLYTAAYACCEPGGHLPETLCSVFGEHVFWGCRQNAYLENHFATLVWATFF